MKLDWRSFLLSFISLFVFLATSTPPSHSQDTNSFFGIKAGASIPLGAYRQASLDGGSFALTGYNVKAEGGWFFKPQIGIGASVGINQHPVDVGLLGWEKVQADPFLEDLFIRSDPYLMLTGMIGVYYHYPVMKKLSIEAKIQGGMLYGKTPYQLYKPQYFLFGPEYYEITSAQDWNLAGNVGLGIRYDISPCFGLLLDSDFTYSNLAFKFLSALGERIDQRQILLLNTTMGLRINL
ncbi:MAG: hypothetical protein KQI35_14005 [Bacteroidetes bacterium]|nr:hypothetical protein [Bacteroidota bacterium]